MYTILQDRQNYIWMGTQTGVTKFDGITFTGYSFENGLAPGSVRVIFSDMSGMLWLGHEGGGITRYNGREFEQVILEDSLIRSNITSINQDADLQLWVTTELDGAIKISHPDSSVSAMNYTHYLQGKSLGDMVFSCVKTSADDLYFITNVGISKYNKEDNTFERYLPDGMFTFFSFTCMFEDSRGNLWFGTNNGGLSKLNKQTQQFDFFDTDDGLAANWITTITEDRKGNIWTGHWKNDMNNGGISCIDAAGNIKIFNTTNGLHDDNIWCIAEDNEGNILIGTTDKGLDIFKGEAFVSYTTQNGLLHDQVNAIIQDQTGEMWLGTNLGISVLVKEGEKSVFKHFNQSTSFISNQIRFFKKDKNNNIWIGTADQGVLMYNIKKKKFVAQPGINSYIPYATISMGITALEIGAEGHLWIGTLEGLVEYDIISGKYIATHTQAAGLAGNSITALFSDSEGDLWIGSDKKKGLTLLHKGEFSINSQINDVVPTCITEDKNGRIWIGTELKGAIVLDKNNVIHYGAEEGLLSNLVNTIVCDEDNNIYIGTNRGLNVIDQFRNRIFTYTRRTGFTGIETKSNAGYIDNSGHLWLGTANGAIQCNRDLLIMEDTAKPQVLITEMMVKGVPVELNDGLKLPSSSNDIIFRFISISLRNPEGIFYQAMLEGLHDGWVDMKETRIDFNKLVPGRYVFRVRVRNDQGMWSALPAQFSFRILAPFYRRGYFIVSVSLLILGMIIIFIRIRERNLKHEKKILEERVSERTLALSLANDELSMKNKDILDSITYAKRIQLAILPSEIPFNETFTVYKAKDIVSGDFYWMNASGEKEFLAAVDCTGHGVPGAFMSFIGYTALKKIIIEQEVYEPAKILNHLNEEVAASLHQKGEDIVNDGMDIALVCFTPGTQVLEYAGAFNPLIIIRKGEILETKADRFAIGRSTGKEKTFTNHSIAIEKGDMIYLFSDGYADQFGGPDGKKFKTSALKDLFMSISHLPAKQQHSILDKTFEEWKGDQEQIDDVLIVGRKF